MFEIINKKVGFNFHVEDSFEAGIALEGWEIKPILQKKINLEFSHVIIKGEELFLLNAQVTAPNTTDKFSLANSTRSRKLLLKKREIQKLIGKVNQDGYTLMIRKVYTKNNKIKMELVLAKGKKQQDKREAVKNRDVERETSRIIKNRSKS